MTRKYFNGQTGETRNYDFRERKKVARQCFLNKFILSKRDTLNAGRAKKRRLQAVDEIQLS